mmetsp:Transcript_52260/g.131199  ORF Transcript_52260/g.131199 Transcript_52260/m.131199 type:complete len:235 (+) Transcript_52260:1357-2061(+)
MTKSVQQRSRSMRRRSMVSCTGKKQSMRPVCWRCGMIGCSGTRPETISSGGTCDTHGSPSRATSWRSMTERSRNCFSSKEKNSSGFSQPTNSSKCFLLKWRDGPALSGLGRRTRSASSSRVGALADRCRKCTSSPGPPGCTAGRFSAPVAASTMMRASFRRCSSRSMVWRLSLYFSTEKRMTYKKAGPFFFCPSLISSSEGMRKLGRMNFNTNATAPNSSITNFNLLPSDAMAA